MGKLSVKKVQVNEAMSEETLCFSADVYEDGKLIAHVSNRGHGGCNDVHPAKGLTYKDVAHLDNLDTECEIFQLVEEANIVKKNQNKAFVLKKDKKVYLAKLTHPFAQMKKMKGYGSWKAERVAKYVGEGYEVLNNNL